MFVTGNLRGGKLPFGNLTKPEKQQQQLSHYIVVPHCSALQNYIFVPQDFPFPIKIPSPHCHPQEAQLPSITFKQRELFLIFVTVKHSNYTVSLIHYIVVLHTFTQSSHLHSGDLFCSDAWQHHISYLVSKHH